MVSPSSISGAEPTQIYRNILSPSTKQKAVGTFGFANIQQLQTLPYHSTRRNDSARGSLVVKEWGEAS